MRKGSFWWRDVLKLLKPFKEMANIQLNSGDSCLFWKDKWSTHSFEDQYPQAYSFANKKFISVKDAFGEGELTNLFALPLSQIAFDQVLNIQQKM